MPPLPKHPVTVAVERGFRVSPRILRAVPAAALLAFERETADGNALAESLLVRPDLSAEARQGVAEKLVARSRGAPVLAITEAIYRGWVQDTPTLREGLQRYFRDLDLAQAEAATRGFHSSDVWTLGNVSIALLATERRWSMAQEEKVLALTHLWPALRSRLRQDADGRSGPKGQGAPSYETPWDVLVDTLPSAETLEDVRPTLLAEIQENTFRYFGMAYEAARGERLLPISGPTFEALMDSITNARRAKNLSSKIALAEEVLVSDPSRDPARVVRAILTAQQRFPSVRDDSTLLLYLLPLTAGSHDLWWERALSSLVRDQGTTDAVESILSVVSIQRLATPEADPSLFEPSAALMEVYGPRLYNRLRFLVAPSLMWQSPSSGAVLLPPEAQEVPEKGAQALTQRPSFPRRS